MALKEDYKDAVFAGLRKYKMLDNGDGTVSLVDMTEYETAGDKFGAKDVNAITKTVNATGEIIADDNDEFKPNQKYEIGRIVIYDNKTWRFKVDHEPGEWDERQVERTNILTVIAEQNKNFAELGENLEKNTFGNQVTLVKDQNYICSSDGYFRIVCAYQEKSKAVGFINDIILVSLSSTNSSSVVINNSMSSIIFVRAGMAIKYIGTNAQGYFIPLI